MKKVNRNFIVTYWQGGLLKVTIQAADVVDAAHILEREGVRPASILKISEYPVEDTITGLQRAVL